MSYEKIILPYIEKLAATGRKTTTTDVIAYRLTSCLRTLEEAGRTTDPLAIRADDFYFLKKALAARAKEATIRTMLTNLDALVQYHGGEPILHDMSLLWNRTVRDRAFITAEDAAIMYEHADPPLRLIIVLGAFMGLRREEMANIRLTDIRTDDIIIHGKGHGESGLVIPQPMPAQVRRELDAYLPWRAAHAPADQDRLLVLLTPKRGRIVKQSKVLNEITDRIAALGEAHGIRVTTHSLRRLYATTVYEVTGHNVATTQALMRHASSITTIDCYISPNEKAKKEAVAALGIALRFRAYKYLVDVVINAQD